jgi:hypothetical protein
MSTNKALLSEVLKRIEILEKKVEKLSTKEESSTKSKKDQVLEIERNLSLWSEKFPGINIRAELEKMLDWLKANNKRKKDYKAFFRNWLRKASSDLGVKAPQEEKIKYIFGCQESSCKTVESPYKDMYYFCSICNQQKIVIDKKR